MVKDLEGEKWANIWGYYGRYKVSNMGRVKSMTRKVKAKNGSWRSVKEKIIAKAISNKYYFVCLCKNHKMKSAKLSRLVAKYFVPNPYKKSQVNHKNCDKLDDRASNLEWCTAQENIDHAVENNLFKRRNVKGLFCKAA